MAIVNIRGTSGSGKSTLVHRYLAEHPHQEIMAQLGDWKKEKVVGYRCFLSEKDMVNWDIYVGHPNRPKPTFIIGSYKSQCGGCDSLSYKGSHPDIEDLVRQGAAKGNVIYEGLTVSSTYTRWLGISHDFPGQFVWAFMATPVETCYERILKRSGGREPKRDKNGLADYNRKHRGCLVQRQRALDEGERVVDLTSDDIGYAQLLTILGEKDAATQP